MMWMPKWHAGQIFASALSDASWSVFTVEELMSPLERGHRAADSSRGQCEEHQLPSLFTRLNISVSEQYVRDSESSITDLCENTSFVSTFQKENHFDAICREVQMRKRAHATPYVNTVK